MSVTCTPLRRSTSAVPPVAVISKPRSARRLSGKIIERLSRLATETKTVPLVGRPEEYAAICDLANAVPNCRSRPMTSPVERISGPSTVSTPWNRPKGRTASLTAIIPPSGRSAASPTEGRVPSARRSAMLSPSAIRAAALASGTPVALATNGTVRDARGLASRT